MDQEKREIAEVLLVDRRYIYSLLHKVISRNPDEEMLNILVSEQSEQAFSLLSDEDGDIMGRTPLFLQQIKKDLTEDKDFIEKLQSEYTRLFVGPLSLVAPPWESVYYGEDGMLFQESTLKVREFYRSFQLLPEGYPHVPDDSLALELAFMTELSNRAMKAFEAEDDSTLRYLLFSSRRFLNEHLLVWIPRFLKRMANAETDYMYPQICLIIDNFIQKDHEILDSILQEM